METQAGIWIDHKRAVVVLLTEAGQEIKEIVFDIGQQITKAGGNRNEHHFTRNDFVAEDKLERKTENDRKDYYDEVILAVRNSAALFVLGPGEAKGEFAKHIKTKKLRNLVIELETADKMTDRQFVAKVMEHFAKSPTSK